MRRVNAHESFTSLLRATLGYFVSACSLPKERSSRFFRVTVIPGTANAWNACAWRTIYGAGGLGAKYTACAVSDVGSLAVVSRISSCWHEVLMSIPIVANLEDELEEQVSRVAGPCVMVLFGASGDLTKRKLIPALFNLAKTNFLSVDFAIMGLSKDDLSLEEWRAQVTSFLTSEDHSSGQWNWFRERLYYERGEFEDPATFTRLHERLKEIDRRHQTGGNYLFYFATAPKFFSTIVQQLGTCGLAAEENDNWRRVVVEKPFGTDLDSAKDLNRKIRSVLHERQIYRIDHYLGKETVQNILVFRFGNGIFEPIWNRRYIDHVEITNAETVGVEQRGGYFDSAGTLRDMVPNHIMQLISLLRWNRLSRSKPMLFETSKAKSLLPSSV